MLIAQCWHENFELFACSPGRFRGRNDEADQRPLEDVIEQPSIVAASAFAAGDGVGVARSPATTISTTPRHERPSRSQCRPRQALDPGSFFHPRHEGGRGEGVPLDMTDAAMPGLGESQTGSRPQPRNMLRQAIHSSSKVLQWSRCEGQGPGVLFGIVAVSMASDPFMVLLHPPGRRRSGRHRIAVRSPIHRKVPDQT